MSGSLVVPNGGISRQDGSNVEYFSEDTPSEFEFEVRTRLKQSLVGQTSELLNVLNRASAGQADAQAAVTRSFGRNPNVPMLLGIAERVSQRAEAFPSYMITPLRASQIVGGVDAYGQAVTCCRGDPSYGQIQISLTTYNAVMSGSDGRYTLIHEVMHFEPGLSHDQIYDFQGLLTDWQE